jgi:hypothetical protein
MGAAAAPTFGALEFACRTLSARLAACAVDHVLAGFLLLKRRGGNRRWAITALALSRTQLLLLRTQHHPAGRRTSLEKIKIRAVIRSGSVLRVPAATAYFFCPDFLVPRERGRTSDSNLYFGLTESETAGHRSCRRRCRPGLYRGGVRQDWCGKKIGVPSCELCCGEHRNRRQTKFGRTVRHGAGRSRGSSCCLNDFGPSTMRGSYARRSPRTAHPDSVRSARRPAGILGARSKSCRETSRAARAASTFAVAQSTPIDLYGKTLSGFGFRDCGTWIVLIIPSRLIWVNRNDTPFETRFSSQ